MDDRNSDDSTARITKVPVRVSVRACRKSLKLNELLNWTPETIISFDQPASQPLVLLAGDRVLGNGHAVKVGSQIGLRLQRIGSGQSESD